MAFDRIHPLKLIQIFNQYLQPGGMIGTSSRSGRDRLATFSDVHPELKSYQLIMAGKGPLADELRDQSPPNVSWVGHVEGEGKRQLLLQCRAAVCLWPEPLGTVVYEAYQVCKPVLASDLGGLRETIRHNATGLLPPPQMDVWLSAIFQIAQDDALALRLGRNDRRWLETEASPASWLRGFQAVMEEAFAKSESNN